MEQTPAAPFRDPSAARAGGYVLVVATVLVAIGLVFHPVPANRLLIGYGWLGDPLFLFGLTLLAALEVRGRWLGLPRPMAWAGLTFSVLAWGRGIGSATGMYFLEPLIFANVPAFLWLAYVGLRIARTR